MPRSQVYDAGSRNCRAGDSTAHTDTEIGRVVLLEVDLSRHRKQTELDWVCTLIHDLRSGVYVWDPDTLFNTPGAIPGMPPKYP